jgi:hypothetical protein
MFNLFSCKQLQNLVISGALIISFQSQSKAQLLTTITPQVAYSTTKSKASTFTPIRLLNKTKASTAIQDVRVTGPHAAFFRVAGAKDFPLLVKPQYRASIPVVFDPAGKTGTFRAMVQITTQDKQVINVPLYGLSAKGMDGEKEPPLNAILQTIGYQVNVGGTALRLGTSPEPIGEEVVAPLFQKAANGPITIKPVARYSPAEEVPYGYYVPAPKLTLKTVASLADAGTQHQTIYPHLASGRFTFDPGQNTFGLFTRAANKIAYTQDHLNQEVSHRVRTYPLKDRAGRLVPHSYLVCFEEAKNGDYQDFVFVVSNIKPVAGQ